MTRFRGKTAVVTGGASGIGESIVRLLVEEEASVVVVDLQAELGQALAADLGDSVRFVRADVANESDVAAAIEAAVEAFGRLDVLHNNAGIHESDLTTDMTVETLPIDVWDRLMDINLKGVWLAARAAFPHMRDSGGGAIVNAGSTASLAGYPNCPAYTAAKHAIVGLTKVMALDFRDANIRANCYCPASVDTAMVSKFWEAAEDPDLVKSFMVSTHLLPKRLGYPEEIAKLVCFLASDDASFINGASILIDGGSLAWRGSD